MMDAVVLEGARQDRRIPRGKGLEVDEVRVCPLKKHYLVSRAGHRRDISVDHGRDADDRTQHQVNPSGGVTFQQIFEYRVVGFRHAGVRGRWARSDLLRR